MNRNCCSCALALFCLSGNTNKKGGSVHVYVCRFCARVAIYGSTGPRSLSLMRDFGVVKLPLSCTLDLRDETCHNCGF